MSSEETRRSVELPDYFAVLPAFRGIYHNIDYSYPNLVSTRVSNPYISADQEYLSVGALRIFLKDNNLLGEL